LVKQLIHLALSKAQFNNITALNTRFIGQNKSLTIEVHKVKKAVFKEVDSVEKVEKAGHLQEFRKKESKRKKEVLPLELVDVQKAASKPP
jgi:hypothetical protein